MTSECHLTERDFDLKKKKKRIKVKSHRRTKLMY